MKNLPHQLKNSLVPLLLSLAVSQAYAVEVVHVGIDGAAGVAGQPGQDGTAGAAGSPLLIAYGQAQAALTLTLYGGAGGAGGNGGLRAEPVFAGNGGNGGHGGAADASVATSTAASLDSAVEALVFGGVGGRAGEEGGLQELIDSGGVFGPYDPAYGTGGVAGNGGAASSAVFVAVGGAGNVTVRSVAVGGTGGAVDGVRGAGGAGGAASATAYGQSETGNVSVTAEARGGNGNDGYFSPRSTAGIGADVALNNAVAGRTRGELVLVQHAAAGAAGGGGVADPDQPPPNDVRAANASSILTLSDALASALTARVSAVGGNGATTFGYLYDGGTASALLTLTSTREGAVVDGSVQANGGTGSAYVGGGAGGLAEAVAVLTGLADVRGSAAAFGGSAGASTFGGNGGAAHASLTISAGGKATGSAVAVGGDTGAESTYYLPARGVASAVVELAGAGAQGSAASTGSSAESRISARTSGAQAVDVAASAHADWYGGANAVVLVESGVGPNGAGAAAVKARADADSAFSFSSASASAALDVTASGDIDGVSQARSGDALYGWYGSPPSVGDVASSARGVTSGAHTVTLSAIARGGEMGFGQVIWRTSGGASATAFGQSGSGTVNVSAEARASGGTRVFEWDAYGAATASAKAVNLSYGGRGTARATAWGGDAKALASAAGVSATGSLVRVTGSGGAVTGVDWMRETQFSVTGNAYGANYYDAAAFQLPAAGGAGQVVVSNVSAGPAQVGEIAGLGPAVAAALQSVAGVGMHAFSSDAAVAGVDPWNPTPLRLSATGEFEFDGVSGQHLLLGFVSASFMNGFDTLELSISNNGVDLFSRLFTSADDAMLFFSDHVLDLGLFGAGAQDVRVSSIYSYYQPGAFAFNYVVGSGAAVAAVPEASSWLMLVLGLGTMVIVARRRGAPARRA